MENNKKMSFDFTDFLESKKSISLCLAIGVLFLVNTYQKIIFLIDPDNDLAFVYPYAMRVVLSHLDSLFFGFATIIIMFQSEKKETKILYCVFESVMIFLNFNRVFIEAYFEMKATFFIVLYMSIFAGFTLFILGTLAKSHRINRKLAQDKQEEKEEKQRLREERKAVQNYGNSQNNIGFDFENMPKNAQDKGGRPPITEKTKKMILYDLENGLSIRKTANKYNVSHQSVKNIKNENL